MKWISAAKPFHTDADTDAAADAGADACADADADADADGAETRRLRRFSSACWMNDLQPSCDSQLLVVSSVSASLRFSIFVVPSALRTGTIDLCPGGAEITVHPCADAGAPERATSTRALSSLRCSLVGQSGSRSGSSCRGAPGRAVTSRCTDAPLVTDQARAWVLERMCTVKGII